MVSKEKELNAADGTYITNNPIGSCDLTDSTGAPLISEQQIQSHEEQEQHQQKLLAVDEEIAEKEEILSKLLDTVKSYAAMKVTR
jgi:hypothetical protein